MTAILRKSVKNSVQTFDKDSKVSIKAITFGTERIYNYICDYNGAELIVTSDLLEGIH